MVTRTLTGPKAYLGPLMADPQFATPAASVAPSSTTTPPKPALLAPSASTSPPATRRSPAARCTPRSGSASAIRGSFACCCEDVRTPRGARLPLHARTALAHPRATRTARRIRQARGDRPHAAQNDESPAICRAFEQERRTGVELATFGLGMAPEQGFYGCVRSLRGRWHGRQGSLLRGRGHGWGQGYDLPMASPVIVSFHAAVAARLAPDDRELLRNAVGSGPATRDMHRPLIPATRAAEWADAAAQARRRGAPVDTGRSA